MTTYVCTELAPVDSGYIVCKTWAVYEDKTWVDSLVISKQEMVLIGSSIISTLAIILAFVMVAKASKTL